MSSLRPLNLYGWSKNQFDKLVIRQAKKGNCPPYWAGMKFFNVFGPNEFHKGNMRSVPYAMYESIKKGERPKLFRSNRIEYKDGFQTRDFVYVQDCVEAILHLSFHNRVSGLYNVGTGIPRTFLDLAHAVIKATGAKLDVEFIDMPQSIEQKYQYWTKADVSKIRAIGFDKPFRTLEESCAILVEHFDRRAASEWF